MSAWRRVVSWQCVCPLGVREVCAVMRASAGVVGRLVLNHSTHCEGLIPALRRVVKHPGISTVVPGRIRSGAAVVDKLTIRVTTAAGTAVDGSSVTQHHAVSGARGTCPRVCHVVLVAQLRQSQACPPLPLTAWLEMTTAITHIHMHV